MPKKPPLYKQLGYKTVKNSKGTVIGYEKTVDGKREYLSNRDMRKLYETPAKGSKGWKEYRTSRYGTAQPTTKPKGPSYKERLADFLRKTPGGTEEWFKTGQQPEIPHDPHMTSREHNKLVDKQRQDAIKAQYKAGLISQSEKNSLLATERLAASYRDKVLRIEERIKNARDLSGKDYLKLKREQQVYLNQYRKYENKLQDVGAIPEIDEFKYGWYGGERSPGTRRHHRPRKKAS